jgi:F0F1-type ATP synthase epsilon subunit
MSMTLKVVSARGVEYSVDGVDRIVVRRREVDFDPGSEVAICPGHAPLLMQTQRCTMRVTRGAQRIQRELPPGVLEVCDERVTIALT